SEIGTNHFGIRLNLFWSSERELLSVVEYEDCVCETHDHGHFVFDEKDGHAPLRQRANQVGKVCRLFFGYAAGRFVEQQQFWFCGQSHCDRGSFLHFLWNIGRQIVAIRGDLTVFEYLPCSVFVDSWLASVSGG